MIGCTCYLRRLNGNLLPIAIPIQPLSGHISEKEEGQNNGKQQSFEELSFNSGIQLPGAPGGGSPRKFSWQCFRLDGDHFLKKFYPDTDLKASGLNENFTTYIIDSILLSFVAYTQYIGVCFPNLEK